MVFDDVAGRAGLSARLHLVKIVDNWLRGVHLLGLLQALKERLIFIPNVREELRLKLLVFASMIRLRVSDGQLLPLTLNL